MEQAYAGVVASKPGFPQPIRVRVSKNVRVSSVVSCCNLNGKHSDTGNEPGTCVRTNVPCRIRARVRVSSLVLS